MVLSAVRDARTSLARPARPSQPSDRSRGGRRSRGDRRRRADGQIAAPSAALAIRRAAERAGPTGKDAEVLGSGHRQDHATAAGSLPGRRSRLAADLLRPWLPGSPSHRHAHRESHSDPTALRRALHRDLRRRVLTGRQACRHDGTRPAGHPAGRDRRPRTPQRDARARPASGSDYQRMAWSHSGWLFYNAGHGRLAAYNPWAPWSCCSASTSGPSSISPRADSASRSL